MERLWAGWRMTAAAGYGSDGVPHLDLPRADGLSLFEAIEQSGHPDDETYVVWRGPTTFAVLNVFPYTTGHLMVLPTKAVASMESLDDHVFDELWRSVRDAVVAVKISLRPEGVNVGINDGEAGGGSVPDHLHVHVVPRWAADTNFMTTTANARVLPIPLAETWRALRDAWPTPESSAG